MANVETVAHLTDGALAGVRVRTSVSIGRIVCWMSLMIAEDGADSKQHERISLFLDDASITKLEDGLREAREKLNEEKEEQRAKADSAGHRRE